MLQFGLHLYTFKQEFLRAHWQYTFNLVTNFRPQQIPGTLMQASMISLTCEKPLLKRCFHVFPLPAQTRCDLTPLDHSDSLLCVTLRVTLEKQIPQWSFWSRIVLYLKVIQSSLKSVHISTSWTLMTEVLFSSSFLLALCRARGCP